MVQWFWMFRMLFLSKIVIKNEPIKNPFNYVKKEIITAQKVEND